MPDTDELPTDATFDLLSSPRRRFVVAYLARVDRPITVTDLATAVAAWEEGVSPDALDRRARKRVYVSLYQTHVPKLVGAGVLDRDRDTGTVEITDVGHVLAGYLDASDRGPDWARYALTVALVGVALYLALAFDAPGLAAVPDAAAVALVVVAFAAIAVAQLASADRVTDPDPRP